MISKSLNLPDIKELKTEIIKAIVGSFGITKTAFFIREMMYQKTDYLEVKESLFGEKSSQELCTEISKWKVET